MSGAFALSALFSYGCSNVLGLDSYTFEDSLVSGSDAASDGRTLDDAAPPVDAGADASCQADLRLQCYPCEPTTTEQFLNSCTEAACIPFDRGRLKALLLADGGLPPLPRDGGSP